MNNDEVVDRWVGRYPPADISPSEFESFIVNLLETAAPGIEDFRVNLHEVIPGVDGSFDFDATLRYRLMGFDFLVVIEAKRHRNPVKRELVQVLHSKVQSVGANKGIMFSTAPFQRGAIEFAKVHGVALVVVTEGRFTLETRSLGGHPPLSREQALALYGLPTFAAVLFSAGDTPGSTRLSTLDENSGNRIREELLSITL